MKRPDVLPQGARSLYGNDLSGWTYALGFYNSPDGRQTLYEDAVDWDALEPKKTVDDLSSFVIADSTAYQTITFWRGQEEILRFAPDGRIYVQGRLATNDLEVVDALRASYGLPKLVRP